MSVILMTTLFYKALILQGEIWCWSLLGLKGLKVFVFPCKQRAPALLKGKFYLAKLLLRGPMVTPQDFGHKCAQKSQKLGLTSPNTYIYNWLWDMVKGLSLDYQ